MKKLLAIITLAVVLVIAVNLFQGDRYREFMETAGKTNGAVLHKEERIADAKTRRKEYWVTYQYSVGDGHTRITRANIEYPDIWEKLREGQVENIYYNKNNPSESHLAVVLDRKKE